MQRSIARALSRRGFLKTGGALVTGGALAVGALRSAADGPPAATAHTRIKRHRTLGRTGFKVADICMGCAATTDSNLFRYAYDRGINYFDVGESYGNGAAESMLGEAMQFMDRRQIFITTKLVLTLEETAEKIHERFGRCLERMKTTYADALFLHEVSDVRLVRHAGFHAAVQKLTADGRLRFAGISAHGPRDEGDSMEKVLVAAVDDGRFDLMLLRYNFLNREEAERVLAACKTKNVGTATMKAVPGYLEVTPWDPENPATEYAAYIESATEGGLSREAAIANVVNWIALQQAEAERIKPFAAKYGIKTNERLAEACVQWVLKNKDVHSVCVSLMDFEQLERIVALSGTELSQANQEFLEDYAAAFGSRYCRHGCRACAARCPHGTPVSTIMRYCQYFTRQGREKYAMARYASLNGRDASRCYGCRAPCDGACPHGLVIPAAMVRAHSLLTLT